MKCFCYLLDLNPVLSENTQEARCSFTRFVHTVASTHLVLPRGRSDCSDRKLVLLVLEMADTSLTSLSEDLAETLSQLRY